MNYERRVLDRALAVFQIVFTIWAILDCAGLLPGPPSGGGP